MKVEVSRPHYHPGKDFDLKVTKKRDLSVPPHWVANERMEDPVTGISLAIVMPARDEELYEYKQSVHIHMPENVEIDINGKKFIAKVKLSDETFAPVVHFDQVFADAYSINPGDEATL